MTPYVPPRFPTRLERQESYLLCPDRPAMKIDTSFPVSRIRVFYRKLPRRLHLKNAAQHQFHVTRSGDTLPKNFIDIYHWSVD